MRGARQVGKTQIVRDFAYRPRKGQTVSLRFPITERTVKEKMSKMSSPARTKKFFG